MDEPSACAPAAANEWVLRQILNLAVRTPPGKREWLHDLPGQLDWAARRGRICQAQPRSSGAWSEALAGKKQREDDRNAGAVRCLASKAAAEQRAVAAFHQMVQEVLLVALESEERYPLQTGEVPPAMVEGAPLHFARVTRPDSA